MIEAGTVRAQFGVVASTRDADGRTRVLVVSARGGRGWVMPKGSPIRGLSGPEVAAREAFEEAGLLGQVIGTGPLGTYTYAKRGGLYEVTMFLMRVDRQLKAWPERGQRRLAWLSPLQAAALLRHAGLSALLRRVADGLAPMLDAACDDRAPLESGAQRSARLQGGVGHAGPVAARMRSAAPD